MPELPEVETIVRGLQAALDGQRIESVHLGKTDFIENPAALECELPGCRLASIERHGKFIVLELDPLFRAAKGSKPAEKWILLIHLGMTGQLTVVSPASPLPPHTHVRLLLDDGRELRYTDIRRFGRFLLFPESHREKFLGPLGADPLEANGKGFRERIAAHRARIKALLLDQHVFRGMGNIYTDESLWCARIHPARLGSKLKEEETARLFRSIQKILREAIRLRGSSISDYVDAGGERGEFQLRHRVYQREGKKCFRCGSAIRRIIVAGRGTYFCPSCQPAPRQKQNSKRSGSSGSKRALQRRRYMSAAPVALNTAP